ncbi:MAG: 4Fe-4S dicluster domain-containing protein [Desulfobacterales bacterium]|nr:4Fe-4S dicluster domain-containing protein [Desulfobacteraceae bacterium]MBT4364311.1 4Fe-4S dicluster domain-containing protein [Desulfobacteraceae bacterium]MBT7084886.1 4Fe-4S dicluster domain-containing protein [Desulfobacterales bacterium]MBT7698284.1 4Fe-4S dicluster domain-containing protein [Desulfobacterales bacterium]
MMKNSRRSFLKIAGISAIGFSMTPVVNVFASSGQEGNKPEPSYSVNKKALKAKRWGLVIDTRKLSEEIVEELGKTCSKIHNIPEIKNKDHEIKWIWGEEFKHAFPGKENEFLDERMKHLSMPVLCNHCKDAPCVRVCPTKATFKRPDGIVLMDFHRCIGCRFCMAACPYGSRSFNFIDPRTVLPKDRKEWNLEFPTRMKGVVEKCNFCAERLAVGKTPACVEASHGALAFGDLEDPKSEVRKLLKSNYTIRRKPSLGTGPSVYYIV